MPVVDNTKLASLFEENMGLITSVVQSFRPKNHEERDELLQIGRIGLWKAHLKYDGRSAFSTCAWNYIRWEILRYFKRNKIQSDISLDTDIPNTHTESLWEYLPDSLSEKEKTVLHLKLEGNSFIDIGKRLGYSKGWANNIYRTAVEKIKEANGYDR